MKNGSRIKALTAFFRSRSGIPAGESAALLSGKEAFVRAQSVISAYYAVLLFLSVNNLYSWQTYLTATDLAPRWPVFWLRYVDTDVGISWILWLHLFGGLVAVTLARFRLVRILVFVSLLEFLALKYSFGPINHGDHLSILIGFVLIFLPPGWRASARTSREVRAATLLVFSGCQALIMLTYSMAGFWKISGVVRQVIMGEVHALAPKGLAQQVAAKLLSVESTTPLGPWLIEHYAIGWLLMVGTLYLQFFALWAAFRPSLHQCWALALILFHVASHLTIGVGFAQNTLWLALFFLLSPFRPQSFEWRRTSRDLPVVGPLLSLKGSI